MFVLAMGTDERRARLAIRHRLAIQHRLAGPATTPVEVARSVLALHATDPATVFLSVRARAPTLTVADIERSLYVDHDLLRMLGMRRTMFVLPTADAPMVQSACTDAVAAQQRTRYIQLMTQAGVGDAALLDQLTDQAAAALLNRGEATGAQLSTDVPGLRSSIRLNEGKAYGGDQNLTTWVLLLLAAQGRAIRGRPRGSWTSTQWIWSPVQAWLPDGIREAPVPQARVDLARRWLATFGPASRDDLKWWTGWTVAQVKQALAPLEAVEVDLGGATGLVLPDDIDPTPAPEPWVALLPALDPTPMGWAERSWFLGPHAEALFDRSGNIGPTVWSKGRIVGGWAQQRDGPVVYRLLEKVDAATTRAIARAADELTEWIGPVRIKPRFRTPLEKELSAW
jgi:Winged helix DNA-binding domain